MSSFCIFPVPQSAGKVAQSLTGVRLISNYKPFSSPLRNLEACVEQPSAETASFVNKVPFVTAVLQIDAPSAVDWKISGVLIDISAAEWKRIRSGLENQPHCAGNPPQSTGDSDRTRLEERPQWIGNVPAVGWKKEHCIPIDCTICRALKLLSCFTDFAS